MEQTSGTPPEIRPIASVPCQLEAFPTVLESGAPSREEPWSWYLRRRARGALGRARAAAARRIGRSVAAPLSAKRSAEPAAAELLPGDRVRVRSAEYIRSTLDPQGRFAGCGFGDGMYAWCGKELRVLRRVELFFDEGRWRMLKARHMVLLEGVHCDGSSLAETGGCDRMCFYFWRTEWLEKIG